MTAAKKFVQNLQAYLSCPCQFFAPMQDDAPLREAYQKARERGQAEGFTPVFVVLDEENLSIFWDILLMNSYDDLPDKMVFDVARVAHSREAMLATPLANGSELLAQRLQRHKEDMELDGVDWADNVLGKVGGGEAIHDFLGYWNEQAGETHPLLLAEIPVQNPWEVFAYLPFGGWNDCPDALEMMACAKHWYNTCGAVPALISHDMLECKVPQPLTLEQAQTIALEQYAFCPDLVVQGVGTIGTLTDDLMRSTDWFFWWD